MRTCAHHDVQLRHSTFKLNSEENETKVKRKVCTRQREIGRAWMKINEYLLCTTTNSKRKSVDECWNRTILCGECGRDIEHSKLRGWAAQATVWPHINGIVNDWYNIGFSLSLFSFDTVKFYAELRVSHRSFFEWWVQNITNAYEINNLSGDKSNYHKAERICEYTRVKNTQKHTHTQQ